jgi:hypothetical protein
MRIETRLSETVWIGYSEHRIIRQGRRCETELLTKAWVNDPPELGKELIVECRVVYIDNGRRELK